MPSLSPTCIALVKNFEGYNPQPVPLADGRWLVGYNHIRVTLPEKPVSEGDAMQILQEDLEAITARLNNIVHISLTQCQTDALVCFAFSIGMEAFERSDVLRHVNAGEQIAAACAMESWRKSTVSGESIVLDALVRRRAVEKSLFLYEGIRAPAASALVRPEVDPVAAVLNTPSRGAARKQDEVAQKLRTILAQEPQTVNALHPPPEGEEEAKGEEPEINVAGVKAPRDLVGYTALGALGGLLIAMGMTGAQDDHGVSHIVFTAPGVIAVVMSIFYLLKRAGD